MSDDPGDPFTEQDQKRLDRKTHNAAISRITKLWKAMDDPCEEDLQDAIELEGYEINDLNAFYGMYAAGQPLRTIIATAIVDQRPQLAAALAAIEAGQAATLVVSKLDRLSRSVHDAAGLLDRAHRAGWSLVALDLGVDTSTPAGEAMANVMATFGQLERKMIGQRTKDALAVKRAQGVRLGRPSSLPREVVARIVAEHQAGGTWSGIARSLNADNVPTAQGGACWYPATVRTVANGQDAATLVAS